MALPQPPRRAAPDVFYLEYIPTLWQALFGPAPLGGQQHPLQVELSIDAHAYRARVEAGALHIRPTTASDAPAVVHITCTLPDWHAGVRSILPQVLQRMDKSLAAARPTAEALLHLWSPQYAAQLEQNRGTVVCHYEDEAGDVATYTVHIADGAGPQALVHLRDTDVQALLHAKGGPAALLRSRIRLAGDTAYLMRLVTLLPAH